MSYATLTHLQGTAYNPTGSAFAVCEPVWPSGKTRDGKKGGGGGVEVGEEGDYIPIATLSPPE